MSKIKKMDIKEFRDSGLLQEINRLFLHPMGLALEITADDGKNEKGEQVAEPTMFLSGVWDYRDDPEGIAFNNLDDDDSREKALNVSKMFKSKMFAREDSLGYHVQNIPNILTLFSYDVFKVLVEKE